MERERQEFPPNPNETANFLSKLTFFWTLPIFVTGYKRPIDLGDLYETLSKDKSDRLGDILERHFMKDVHRCNEERKKLGITDPKKGPQPSLRNALFKTFWAHVIFIGLLISFNECVIRLLSPIFLGKLLNYFSPKSQLDESFSLSDALWYAGGIVMLSGISAVLMNHAMVHSFHMGMRARVAVCSLVYRKSLLLSRNALGDSSPGKVVNLLSNDVNRFDIASIFLHYLWVSPLIGIIVMYIMWMEIGVSGIVGFLVVFTVMPIQAYTGKLSAKFRLQTAMKTDERVRFMGEIINGIQVIKMYTWEKPFQKLITLARKLEIKVIRKNSYVRAVYMTFLMVTTRIALFAVMATMILMGYKLTSARIFVIATYFNILSGIISSMFVRAIAEVAEAFVALKRLQQYLMQEEFTPAPKQYAITNGNTPDQKGGTEANGIDKTSDKLLSSDASSQKTTLDRNLMLKISKADARWSADKPELTLSIDTLEVKKGKLIGIIGPVGSGKSSLLQAVLNELPLLTGSVEVGGTISYACQESWVFGASVRQNILFGLPHDKHRYNEVVRVCALQRDFQQFQFGDQTLVGERGASLSGGQKARINLARAVYRQADLYLLDDPLSAVDAHVGRTLFEQCILSFLRHHTRVLVTHQLHYLKDADHIVLLKDGKIEMQGSYQDLSASTVQYAQLLSPDMSLSVEEDEKDGDGGGKRERLGSKSLRVTRSRSRKESYSSTRKRADSISSSVLDLNNLTMSAGSSSDEEEEEKGEKEHKEQKASQEESSRKTVKGNILLHYLHSGYGFFPLFLVGLAFIITQVMVCLADYWVSFWTAQEELRDFLSPHNSSSLAYTQNNTEIENLIYTTTEDILSSVTSIYPTQQNDSFARQIAEEDLPSMDKLLSSYTLLYIHCFIVVFLLVIALIRSFTFYNSAMAASQNLHDTMFRGVVRSPMLFFNTNPSGRIMNRFAKDMGAIDELLPKAILDAGQILLNMTGAVFLACFVNYYFLIPIFIIGSLFLMVRNAYLKTSKNIKRMEGIARSPVFTHLNATLCGLSTIRAFGAQEILKSEFDYYQDIHTSAWYMFITTSSAFGFLLDIMCLCLIASVTFSFLLFDMGLTSDKVGLAITQCTSLTFMVQWGIRQSAEVANQLMAVERVLEYKHLQPEKGVEPDEIDKARKTPEAKAVMAYKLIKPPRDWPEDGRIVFDSFSMKYTKDEKDAFVITNLVCEIQPTEKIGIVGRTGAGKSSLISALFRLAFNHGTIALDKVDTKDVSLTDLRKKISIIPQDPFLFSGTLRRNLDPFEEFSDTALWKALEDVELKDAITGPAGLESKVADGGTNFSVGQRQLVCLARAVLRNNRVLMLDEATANVDPHTDSLIQKTIREKFAKCTVLTVAHRLNTIMDSDRVMVMDHGRMVEFDHSYKLLLNKDSFLSRMTVETGKQNAKMLFEIAKKDYFKKNPLADIKMIDED